MKFQLLLKDKDMKFETIERSNYFKVSFSLALQVSILLQKGKNTNFEASATCIQNIVANVYLKLTIY